MPGKESGDLIPNQTLSDQIGPKIIAAQIESLRLMVDMGAEVIDYFENYDGVDYRHDCLKASRIISLYVPEPVIHLLVAGAFVRTPETYKEAVEYFEDVTNNRKDVSRAEQLTLIKVLTDAVKSKQFFWEQEYKRLYGKPYGVIELTTVNGRTQGNGLGFDPWLTVVPYKSHTQEADIEFSIRAVNCFLNNDIKYLGQLVQFSAEELLRTPNFARISLEGVESTLSLYGLRLGLTEDSYYGPLLKNFNQELAKKRQNE